MGEKRLYIRGSRLTRQLRMLAIREKSPHPIQIGLFGTPSIVAQWKDLARPFAEAFVIARGSGSLLFDLPRAAVATIRVPVNANRFRCLLNLPRLAAVT